MISIPLKKNHIKRKRLYEEVVERIQQLINSGEIRPGDSLPSERELMEIYGVGRPAIREALLTLQKAGFVSVSGGGRTKVIEPTAEHIVESLSTAAHHWLGHPEGVKNFQAARKFFECGLARYAAQHATEDDLQLLMKALQVNKDSMNNSKLFAQTDVDFHYVLAMIPKNSIFKGIHAAISEWLIDQRHTALSSPGENKIAYQAHKEIAEAIFKKNADLAESLMENHLDQVAEAYWEITKSQEMALKDQNS
ncbi:MAG: transcriptional regulator NanR [SAR324 cluster bacterium]|nr:transcriptional regulator NanR [SAR324 cluster bacterium]